VEETGSEIGSISCEIEYKLILYKHWNIYESMYFSNYLGTKLELWKNMRKRNISK
jgi:cell division control protein 45